MKLNVANHVLECGLKCEGINVLKLYVLLSPTVGPSQSNIANS